MARPLASFPISATSNLDDVRSAFAEELAEVRLDAQPNGFFFEMNAVDLGRITVGYNRFGSDTDEDVVRMGDHVAVAVGVGPSTVSQIDGEQVVCTERALVAHPSRRMTHHRPANGGVVFAKAGIAAIDDRVREVIDRRPKKPIAFERSVDLSNGVGAHIARLLEYFVETIDRDPAILEEPLLRAGFDEMFLNAIIAIPSNYSGELTSDRRPAAPGMVRRAEEFLEANAQRAITMANVAAECNCSERALFAAFRRYRGHTPMQFLAQCRLRTARAALRSPSPGDTVTSIAHAAGFAHLGRFADAYHARFGERPSETMHRA